MNNRTIIQKLRRLHTLLVLGKRSNNLALAIRRALDNICKWDRNVDEIVARVPVRQLFAGYGPKFIKLFDELLRTGDIAMIRQLQPQFDPFFCYLCEIPGIGETMARRMFFDRSICSMDDLRIAYTNDILRRIPAFGDARLQTIEKILWNSQADSDSAPDLFDFEGIAADPEPGILNVVTSESNSGQLDLFSENPQNWLPRAAAPEPDAAVVPRKNSSAMPPVSETSGASVAGASVVDDKTEKKAPQDSSARYPREFIESNSVLFRTTRTPKIVEKISNNTRVSGRSEHALPVPATDSLDSLHLEPESGEVLEPETSTSPESHSSKSESVCFSSLGNSVAAFDPAVDAQLQAFIERDLRERGEVREVESGVGVDVMDAQCQIPEPEEENDDNNGDNGCSKLRSGGIEPSKCAESQMITASLVQADRIDVQELTASLVQADVIMASSVMLPEQIAHSDSRSRNIISHDISCKSLTADSVHARVIIARTITARYIDARCIRPLNGSPLI